MADLDYVISEMKSIVPRKIMLDYCTQNNKEIRQIGKENFDKIGIFVCASRAGAAIFLNLPPMQSYVGL
jgi:hypothetical protein